jgi:hypothetical protein
MPPFALILGHLANCPESRDFGRRPVIGIGLALTDHVPLNLST